jgi:large subunit ribosomal protein L25
LFFLSVEKTMSVAFELHAEPRQNLGKGASRRLRRQGRLPAVLYGGGKDPETLDFEHNKILQELHNEAFYSQILDIKIGSRTERAVLRDLQRHPFKPTLLHLDLQRVTADEKVRVHVPLHFLNQETSRGVKLQGGTISHLKIEVEIACLPANLPEFIEVDLAELEIGESIYLSQLKLPEGVEIVELSAGAEYDVPVVSIHGRRSAAAEEAEGEEGGE